MDKVINRNENEMADRLFFRMKGFDLQYQFLLPLYSKHPFPGYRTGKGSSCYCIPSRFPTDQ